MSDYITLLRSEKPANKEYVLNDGVVEKKKAPPITRATAKTVYVPDQMEMLKVIQHVQGDPHAVILLGYIVDMLPVTGAQESEDFLILPEDQVTDTHIDGMRVFSRTKKNLKQSNWILLDYDPSPDMPEDLQYQTASEWKDAMRDMLPGLSGMIITASNTSRVLQDGMPYKPSPNSHAYVQVEDAEDVDRFAKALLIHAHSAGYGYMQPRRSTDTGETIGHVPWAIFDPSVFSRERLIYEGMPVVKGKGLSIDEAKVATVQGARLDTRTIATPDTDQRSSFKEKTGFDLKNNNAGLHFNSLIEIDMPIEMAGGGSITMEEYWLSGNMDKVRCQSPFRDSDSEAAFLNRHTDGTPFLYEIGLQCKFTPKTRPPVKKFLALAEAIPPGEWDTKLDPVLKAIAAEDNPLARKNATRQLVACSNKLYTISDIEAAIKAQTQEEEAEQNGDWVAQLNRFHALVTMGKDERIATLGNGGEFIFRTDRSFKVKMNNRLTPDGDPMGNAWLMHPDRHDCSGIVFEPRVSFRDDYKGIPEGDQLNVWTGYKTKPVKGKWDLIHAHLLHVLCGGEGANLEWLLDWLAKLFQDPSYVHETIIALNSLQGSGKGLIVANMLIEIIIGYAHSFRATHAKHVGGEFNAHLRGKILIFADEAFFGGKKEDANSLKGMTDKMIAITPKGVDTQFTDSSASLIMASNESYMANVDPGDRRMAFLPVSDHRKGDKPYFDALAKEIYSGGSQAFLHEMLTRDLSGWDRSALPPFESELRGQLMDKSADTDYQYIFKVLMEGNENWFKEVWDGQWYDDKPHAAVYGYYDNGVVPLNTPGYSWDTHTLVINKRAFFEIYREQFANKYEQSALDSMFYTQLKNKYGVHRKIGGFMQTQKRPMIHGKKEYAVFISPLPQAREIFAKVSNRQIEWVIDDD